MNMFAAQLLILHFAFGTKNRLTSSKKSFDVIRLKAICV